MVAEFVTESWLAAWRSGDADPCPRRPPVGLSGTGGRLWNGWLRSTLLGGFCILAGGDGVAAQAPTDPSAPERYRAVRELSVGDIDGPLSLTEVAHVLVDGTRVFVSQPDEWLVRVLSADTGALLGEWGGPGDGPGELRDIYWMGVRDSLLTVMDTRASRLTIYTPEGAVHETIPVRPPSPAPPFIFGGWILPASDPYYVVIGSYGINSGVDRDYLPWVLADREGRVQDTLPSLRKADGSIVIRRESGATSIGRPLHAADRFAMAVDGSLFVQVGFRGDNELTLMMYHTADRIIETVELAVDPVHVPQAVRDSIEGGFRDAFQSRGIAAGVSPGDLDAALEMPEWIPAVDELFVTAEGEIWLREPAFTGPTHLWRVIEADGTITAEVEVPFGAVLRDRAGDHVWGYRVDPEWGFYTVERYRLEPTGG